MEKGTIAKWLTEHCKPEEVKRLPDGAEYLAIGTIEEKLDMFDCWSTGNQNFQIFKTGNYWFASGSLVLTVTYDGLARTIVGGVTIPIAGNDKITDYEAVVYSFALANAAKKLGNQFGRALNGRLDKGETAIPITNIREERTETEDNEFEAVKAKVQGCTLQEEAMQVIEQSGFRYNTELRKIANSKPSCSKPLPEPEPDKSPF